MSVGLLGTAGRISRVGGVHIRAVANPPSDSPLPRSSSFCNVVTHVDDQAQLAGRVMARIDNKAENQAI